MPTIMGMNITTTSTATLMPRAMKPRTRTALTSTAKLMITRGNTTNHVAVHTAMIIVTMLLIHTDTNMATRTSTDMAMSTATRLVSTIRRMRRSLINAAYRICALT